MRLRFSTGDKVTNAQTGVDESGTPEVNITLDSAGGRLMQNATRTSVGEQMAVLFIENKHDHAYRTRSRTYLLSTIPLQAVRLQHAKAT